MAIFSVMSLQSIALVGERPDISSGKGVIVFRTVMPPKEHFLHRLSLMSSAISTNQKYRDAYDILLLVDETQRNGTLTFLQRWFSLNAPKGTSVPHIHVTTEKQTREEFPGLEGYIDGSDNVNKKKGLCCGLPIMWEFLVPPFCSMAVKKRYKFAWHLEDDVWAIGLSELPLLDLIFQYDEAIAHLEEKRGKSVDLAGTRITHNACPFNAFSKQFHTSTFDSIISKFLNTSSYKNQKQISRKRSGYNNMFVPWTFYNQSVTPRWICLSDAIFRHSLNFSQYLHDLFSRPYGSAVYRQAEGLQQPLAWYGGFTMVDLQSLLEQPPMGINRMLPKLKNKSKVMEMYSSRKKSYSTFIFHS